MAASSHRKFQIKQCRSCKSTSLLSVLSLGDQYLSDFTKENKKPAKFPLNLTLCKKCFLLQLQHTAPQSILYTERYGYKSGINQTMKKELQTIVKKAMLHLPKRKKIVAVDIGANDGTLLRFYPKSVYRVGVEPIKKFAKECKQYANVVLNDFFNAASYTKKMKSTKADIVTAISCFYDIDDPNGFVSDVKKILKSDGVFVIQQNYLVGMLELNAFDNIVHEHLKYYSLLSLENLLQKHDLEVFDVEFSEINGGSFRTYIAYKGTRRIRKSVRETREKERAMRLDTKKVYSEFAKRVKKNSKALLELVKKLTKKGKTVFIYGASTRGNTLIQYYGLNNILIKAAVERNPEKWGKRISSVNIPIISEEKARTMKPDYMLVLPWFFKKEFLKRESGYLRSGGHFVFPLPKVEIV